MRLQELKESQNERYVEMLHHRLEQGGFGPVIDKVLNRLSEIQWHMLVRNKGLHAAAMNNYDHADDSGESIDVSARDVAKAFIELGLENA